MSKVLHFVCQTFCHKISLNYLKFKQEESKHSLTTQGDNFKVSNRVFLRENEPVLHIFFGGGGSPDPFHTVLTLCWNWINKQVFYFTPKLQPPPFWLLSWHRTESTTKIFKDIGIPVGFANFIPFLSNNLDIFLRATSTCMNFWWSGAETQLVKVCSIDWLIDWLIDWWPKKWHRSIDRSKNK